MTTQTISENEFLKNFDISVFPRPSTAVDTVIFTVLDQQLQVLVMRRANHPCQGRWALVGGYVDIDVDKDLEATAMRKLKEKTGVVAPYLEQYQTYGNCDRDPRGWSLTTVYFALMPVEDIQLQPGVGASEIKWLPITDGAVDEDLAFDHAQILRGCTERLRNKLLYTTLPVYLCPPQFSLSELQKRYEIILGKAIDRKSFRRRWLRANILEETGEMRQGATKPAKLYRLVESERVHFFVRNLEG